jgi:hypothetical protein
MNSTLVIFVIVYKIYLILISDERQDFLAEKEIVDSGCGCDSIFL